MALRASFDQSAPQKSLAYSITSSPSSVNVVEGNPPVERRKDFGEVAHLLHAMLVQPPRKLRIEVLRAHLPHLRLGQGDRRIAMRDYAEPKTRAHLASIIGITHEMTHASDMEWRFQEPWPCADRERSGRTIPLAVERLGGVVKVHT